MVTIPYSRRVSKDQMLNHFTKVVGGCRNPLMEGFEDTLWDDKFYAVQAIRGGELDGMFGLVGHNAEKGISWAVAIGGSCLYVETVPESYETMLLLELA